MDQPEITGSCAATLNNLRYIKLSVDASTDSTMEFKFDDVKFWNGVTSSTTAEPADANIVGTDEKAAITNVPVGTRYEETDTRKIYRMKSDNISGADLKVYWKFDDTGDPNVNDAGNVTGNASLGTGADLDATGSPTYSRTSTPTNLGNATRWNQASTTSGDYADAGTSVSQFNFLHSDTPKWTICFWAKTSEASVSNTMLISTNNGNTTRGLELYFYGTSTVKLRVNMTDGSNPDGRPIQTRDFTTLTADGNWHFYVMTCDMSITTALRYSIDDGTRETGNKNASAVASGNAEHALFFRHNQSGSAFISDTTEFCEMSIWDRILTDAEITTLYASGGGLQLDTGLPVWTEKGTA